MKLFYNLQRGVGGSTRGVIIVDIIISANEELKRMIKEVPLDNKNKINPKVFQDMIKEIAKRKD